MTSHQNCKDPSGYESFFLVSDSTTQKPEKKLVVSEDCITNHIVLGQGTGVLPEEDQVKEGQINVILSDSDPLKSF